MRGIVLLYSELAHYMLQSISTLTNEFDVTIFHWPINSEAPFDFGEFEKLTLIEK